MLLRQEHLVAKNPHINSCSGRFTPTIYWCFTQNYPRRTIDILWFLNKDVELPAANPALDCERHQKYLPTHFPLRFRRRCPHPTKFTNKKSHEMAPTHLLPCSCRLKSQSAGPRALSFWHRTCKQSPESPGGVMNFPDEKESGSRVRDPFNALDTGLGPSPAAATFPRARLKNTENPPASGGYL